MVAISKNNETLQLQESVNSTKLSKNQKRNARRKRQKLDFNPKETDTPKPTFTEKDVKK